MKDQVSMSVEVITPEIAEQYLKTNEYRQRVLNRNRVALYAKSISSGDWVLNGESIKFDNNGVLLDGQHRLHAIIKSNSSVETIVMRGLSSESFVTMDQGSQRSISDIFKIEGVANNSIVASIITYYYSLTKDIVAGRSGRCTLRKTSSDFVSTYIENKLMFDEISARVKQGYSICRAFKCSYMGGVAAYLVKERKHDIHKVLQFVDEVYSGVTSYKCIIDLRNVINNDCVSKTSRLSDFAKQQYMAQAWNSYVNGNIDKKLKKSINIEKSIDFI